MSEPDLAAGSRKAEKSGATQSFIRTYLHGKAFGCPSIRRTRSRRRRACRRGRHFLLSTPGPDVEVEVPLGHQFSCRRIRSHWEVYASLSRIHYKHFNFRLPEPGPAPDSVFARPRQL